MEFLIFLVIFSVGVGAWANAWGRNGWGWGAAALLLSPLLTGIVLLIAGKTIEKKAEEANALNALIK
jgi:uncharacterized membrane protein AbrB (regulator of aidB expression)